MSKSSELNSGKTVVKFYATWCGPCKALDAALTQEKLPEGVSLISINIEDDPDMVAEYGVRSVPTTIGLVDGNQVFKIVGNNPSDIIEKSGEM